MNRNERAVIRQGGAQDDDGAQKDFLPRRTDFPPSDADTHADTPADTGNVEDDPEHKEGLAFIEEHREIFEHYARGKITFAPAPPGLNTFAFDLETNTIYINSKFYKKKGFSDEKTAFAAFHEIEHFLEKLQILEETDENGENIGKKLFETYLSRIQDSAYGVMDNCVADIRENRTVVTKTNESYRELEIALYKEDLFKRTDFTKEPKHVQLSYAILREARVPDEKCTVDPIVRQHLDELYAKEEDGMKFMDALTHPDTPMSLRLELQHDYIWPIVEKLREQDIKEHNTKQRDKPKANRPSDDKDKKGDKSDEKDTSDENDGDTDASSDSNRDPGKKWRWRKRKKNEPKPAQKPEGEPEGMPESNDEGDDEGVDPNETDPEKIFKKAYDRAKEKTLNSVPIEKQHEALKKWVPKPDEKKRAEKEYAEKIGVDPKDLREYRDLSKTVNAITNPETNERVMKALSRVFERIIAKRIRAMLAPQYPVEEGEELVDPATLVAEVEAGKLKPKVWQTSEIRDRPQQKFGRVEISLVFDRTISMNDHDGVKRNEQLKAAVLAMNAYADFIERCEEESGRLDSKLETLLDVYAFDFNNNDNSINNELPIRPLEKGIGEKERIAISKHLSTAPGKATNDFTPLQGISKRVSEEMQTAMRMGELKKIVIIFTDGDSGDRAQTERAIKELRDKGVVVACVAVTEAARNAMTLYAPDVRMAKRAEDLAVVLTDLLREHLANV